VFVQVIKGRVPQAARLRERSEVWESELRAGAAGFLGSTGGVTADGDAVLIARFAGRAAAEANSQRPEQGEWWAVTERQFAGDVTFGESEDVSLLMGGGSDAAGFVQIIESAEVDRAGLEAMDALYEKHAAGWRPEVLGGARVWTGPDSFVEAVYFSSEADARSGEGSEPPVELAAQMDEFRELMSRADFTDLTDPWLS